MSPQEQRSTWLSPEEWVALEALAEQHNARATRGITSGEISWRALIRLIAQGHITLVAVDRPAVGDNAAQDTSPGHEQSNSENETGGN